MFSKNMLTFVRQIYLVSGQRFFSKNRESCSSDPWRSSDEAFVDHLLVEAHGLKDLNDKDIDGSCEQ